MTDQPVTSAGAQEQTFDVIVVGSGAAALATALGAVDEGLSVVMVESGERWGGNTAKSGGGMWLPNNPLMQRDGAGDSREEALAYLEATVGEVGRCTSRARKEAFVDGVEDFVHTAERLGLRFARAKDYPDYYPEREGEKIGRSLEVPPVDTKMVGDWWDTIVQPVALPAMTDDVWQLGRAWSSVGGMTRGARVLSRVVKGLARGQRLGGIGVALATSLLRVTVIDHGVPLWLRSPAQELVVEDGRVVGVRVTRDGSPVTLRARRGVMLAGGGFEANQELRRQEHGVDGHTSGARTNLGGPIEAGRAVGAALELMDDAWWGGSIPAATEQGDPAFIVGERSMPHSLMVDARGERFANESESYVDLGHHMLEHDRGGRYWLVVDGQYARRYLRTFALDPRVTKAWKAQGVMVQARTLAELGSRMGVDPDRFAATVERFNGFARAGIDGDFGRGNSAYDRYYGDPNVRPNPNLGTVEHGPFTAYQVVVGDLGTKGGIVTDELARALREDGSVIEGLYAAGNSSASVMGRTYPGPGSTIGPAVVFGLVAARHMAGRPA